MAIKIARPEPILSFAVKANAIPSEYLFIKSNIKINKYYFETNFVSEL